MSKAKRQYWGKQGINLPSLDLTFVQQESYDRFLKHDIAKYLREISPILDFTGKTWELSFLSHYFEEPKLTPSLKVLVMTFPCVSKFAWSTK